MKINVVIEMPLGSTWKYEHDKKSNFLILDRPLNQPIPYNYGYVPNTLEEDGDPIDVFVLTDLPIYPLTQVQVELIGVIKCIDNEKRDNKLLSVVVGDCSGYKEMGIAVIQNYLETYKKGFKILEIGNLEEAVQIYEESLKMYLENKN